MQISTWSSQDAKFSLKKKWDCELWLKCDNDVVSFWIPGSATFSKFCGLFFFHMIFFKFLLLSLTNVIRQRPRTLFYFRLFSSAISLVFSEISASNVGNALSYLQSTHGFSWPRKILKLLAKKIIWSKCPLSLKKKKNPSHQPPSSAFRSFVFIDLFLLPVKHNLQQGPESRRQRQNAKISEQSAVFSVHLAGLWEMFWRLNLRKNSPNTVADPSSNITLSTEAAWNMHF